MNIILLMPKVIRKYLDQFPENRNEAYKYFNYDNRVVEERVHRGDAPSTYKGPDEFTDGDYDGLMAHAKTLVNPILQKYSPRVACEDALHMAIRSFGNGQFDGKVNASKYAVLLQSMMAPGSSQVVPMAQPKAPVMARKKKDDAPKPEEPAPIPGRVLRQLGVKPRDIRRRPGKGTHQLVKYPGGDVVIQKSKR